MMWLFFAFVAFAEARDVQVCAQWTPDLNEAGYADDDQTDGNGDGILDNDKQDRLTTNAPLRTHGLFAIVETRLVDSDPWATSWAGALQIGGTDAGCTDVFSAATNMLGGVRVRMKVYSIFAVPGVTSYTAVSDDDDTEDVGEVITSSVTLQSGAPDRLDIDLGAGDSRFDIAIILAWALERESGGASLYGWRVHNCAPPGENDPNCVGRDGGGGMDYDNKRLYVDVASNVRRMLHETGHALTATLSNHWADPGGWGNGAGQDTECVAWQTTLQGGPDGLTGHFTDSDEATSLAIQEGIATYYAAQTVNRVDEGDCYVAHRTYDWDHDLVLDAQYEDQQWYSCEDRPLPGLSLNDEDYWGDVCGYPSIAPPYIHSISSEYDWTRAFWDLDTDWGFTFTDMVQVFVFASPTTWTTAAICADIGAGCDDRPYIRMQEGADVWNSVAPGLEAAWFQECVNGICR